MDLFSQAQPQSSPLLMYQRMLAGQQMNPVTSGAGVPYPQASDGLPPVVPGQPQKSGGKSAVSQAQPYINPDTGVMDASATQAPQSNSALSYLGSLFNNGSGAAGAASGAGAAGAAGGAADAAGIGGSSGGVAGLAGGGASSGGFLGLLSSLLDLL